MELMYLVRTEIQAPLGFANLRLFDDRRTAHLSSLRRVSAV